MMGICMQLLLPLFCVFFCLVRITVCANPPDFSTDDESKLRTDTLGSYVKEIRPAATTAISVELYLITINDLDTKTQTFSATGYFNMQWNDSRLEWNSTAYNGTNLLVSDEWTVWRPPVVISNEVTAVKIISDRAIPIRITSAGLVTWSPPLLMQTDCDLVVKYYPFDTQECAIEMTTWGYQLNEVNLITNQINMEDFNDNNEWDLDGFVISRTEVTKESSEEVSKLTFSFTVTRKPTYYVLSEVVPTVLMSFLGPIVFLYPAEGGEKLSYIITVFLAYTVLLTFVSDQLPPSSMSPSILSVYLVTITVLGAVCVMLTIVILNLYYTDQHDNEVPEWLDKVAKFTQVIMCKSCKKKRETGNSIDHSDEVPVKSEQGNRYTNNGKLTWKDIAITFDMFCFRFMMLATIILMLVVIIMIRTGD